MAITNARPGASNRAPGRLRRYVISTLTAMLVAPAALVAAPFWAVAAATRRLPGVFRLQPASLTWVDAMEFDAAIGWRTRPNLAGYIDAGQPFYFTTDAEGWRDTKARMDESELLVFGDSFAFGQGVDEKRVFTKYLGNIPTKLLGSNGYSMVHAVLQMERLGSRLAGRHVVWFIYLGNDLYDNLRPNYGRYRMPFARLRDGEWNIETSHVSAEPWGLVEKHANYAKELARLSTPGPKTDRALAAAAYLIERASRACSGVGAHLSVVTVPRREQVDPASLDGLRVLSPDPERFDVHLLDDELRTCCDEIGVPMVALADHLSHRDYSKVDIHWNRTGHARVGRLLSDLHTQQKSLRARPAAQMSEEPG